MDKGEWFQMGERVVIGSGLAAVGIYLMGLSSNYLAIRLLNFAVCAVFFLCAFGIAISGIAALMMHGRTSALLRNAAGTALLLGFIWFGIFGYFSAYSSNPL